MQFFDFSRMIPSGEMPGIPLFMQFLPLYKKAEELGMVGLLEQSCVDSGISITAKKVLADLSSTTIFYEMDPEHATWHVSAATLKDNLGREVPLRGEAQGLLEFFPLEESASTLTLHISECYKTTPGFFRILIPFIGLKDSDGTMPPDVEEKWNRWQEEASREAGEKVNRNPVLMQRVVGGSWELTFPVDLEPRRKGTFTREIHRTWTFGSLELTVKRLRAGVIHWLLEYEILDPDRERIWQEWRHRQWDHIRTCASREEFLAIQKREFKEESFVLANFDFALYDAENDEVVPGGIFVRDGGKGWFTFRPPSSFDRLSLLVRRLIEYNPPEAIVVPVDPHALPSDLTLPIVDDVRRVVVKNTSYTPYEARRDIFSCEIAFSGQDGDREAGMMAASLEVRSALLEDEDEERLPLGRARKTEEGSVILEFDTHRRPSSSAKVKITSFDLDLDPPIEISI
jgi:hypothetical protein